MYATVTDAEGRAVKGLTQSDFMVLEDDLPQTITTFVGGEFPAAVALAIDRSFSMKGTPLTMARTAGRAFVASLEARRSRDADQHQRRGRSPGAAERRQDRASPALDALDPWSTTSLNDALIRSHRSARRRNRPPRHRGAFRWRGPLQHGAARRRRGSRPTFGRDDVSHRDRPRAAGAVRGARHRYRRALVSPARSARRCSRRCRRLPRTCGLST